MKRDFIFGIAAAFALAGLAAGCSTRDTDAGASGTGSLQLKVSATRAEGSAAGTGYDPLTDQQIRIYNNDGKLLRHYTAEPLPERLELLNGTYRASVEVGQEEPASFEKRFYVGEEEFAVAAGQTSTVEVKCSRQNVAAEVRLDASVAENFGSTAKVWVAAATTDDYGQLGKGTLDELCYTADAKGYFMLPEGVTTLIYRFEGTHNDPSYGENGLIAKQGVLTGLSTGANCSMTFRFSDDAPGYVEAVTILVDDSADEWEDEIVWTDISITGDGFDAETQQDYIPGKSAAVTYKIANITPIKDVTLYAASKSYDLTGSSYPGITVNKENERTMSVSLSDEFFKAIGGGMQSVRLRVRDTSNGELSRTTPFRVQGLLPVGESDYDLWTNRVTLRALVLDAEAGEVNFTLGDRSLRGTDAGENTYTATFEPEWTQTSNAENPAYPAYYLPVEGTGVFAGRDYTCSATIGGETFTGSFTAAAGQSIPGGDMEGNLSCFTTSNTNSTMWGSGNNSLKSGLCIKGQKSGMGGSQCAKMTASATLGILAAGNLFTGTFNMSGTTGSVGFGQKYAYTARPTALRFKYHAKVGTVDIQKGYGGPLAKGEQDKSSIYVAIVDWSARRVVSSGTSAPSGTWDPAAQTDLDGSGRIIAYGQLFISQTTEGDAMVEGSIPLRYYFPEEAAPAGNYTLVIACATSAYGDFMNGCSSNELYVDDFEWVY